jgi:DHA1 family bicyclomycin/chloramphenicol resistance-like MFS transporter
VTPLTVDDAAPARIRRVPGRNETLAMLSAIMALMAMAIDLMLSAFDDMRLTFGLDPTSNEIAGVVTVFFMGLAVAQLFYGPITDRFGRKAVLTASIVIYIIGAVASALAPTLPALLVARFVWGIGAAGARVVATAIARDLYEGVDMAKAMSQIMAVFIMVPVIAPTLGAGIVALFPWQAVFWACAIWAVAMWLWTTRMPETLPPEKRRRLDRADITDSYLTFLRTRPTIWFSISSVFLQAVFTMYLASSELIVSEIFGRRSQFPLVFGAIAVGFGVGALVNGRVVGIFGVRPVITTMLTVLVIGSTGLLTLTVTADGTPGFWVFMPALGALLAMFMFIMPNLNAEAMQPVPQIAGTVSSLSGALRMAGGAVLGGVVAARIDTSLTPFATALLVFSVLAGLSVWFGARTAAETRPSAG